jgi:hypothetical protein
MDVDYVPTTGIAPQPRISKITGIFACLWASPSVAAVIFAGFTVIKPRLVTP